MLSLVRLFERELICLNLLCIKPEPKSLTPPKTATQTSKQVTNFTLQSFRIKISLFLQIFFTSSRHAKKDQKRFDEMSTHEQIGICFDCPPTPSCACFPQLSFRQSLDPYRSLHEPGRYLIGFGRVFPQCVLECYLRCLFGVTLLNSCFKSGFFADQECNFLLSET
jgi:hypothetical protein